MIAVVSGYWMEYGGGDDSIVQERIVHSRTPYTTIFILSLFYTIVYYYQIIIIILSQS